MADVAESSPCGAARQAGPRQGHADVKSGIRELLLRSLGAIWELRMRVILTLTIVVVTCLLGYGIWRRAARIHLGAHVITRQ